MMNEYKEIPKESPLVTQRTLEELTQRAQTVGLEPKALKNKNKKV